MTSYLKVGVLHPLGYPKTCTFFDLSCISITVRGEPLTFPAESMAAIVNTMTVRHAEILSLWPRLR